MNTASVLKDINSLDKTSLNTYISNRIKVLEEASMDIKYFGYQTPFRLSSPIYGLINSDVDIYYDFNNDDYYNVKYDEYFYDFINLIKEKNILSVQGLLVEMLLYLDNYFTGESNYNKYYLLNNRKDLGTYKKRLGIKDISLLKNSGSASSLEYSVLAQNLLSFFSFDSFICLGTLKYDNKLSVESFNVIKSGEVYYLFDFYNKTKVYNINNQYLGCFPFQVEISNEDAINFLNEDYTLELNDYIRVWNENNYAIRNLGIKRYYCIGNNLELESVSE